MIQNNDSTFLKFVKIIKTGAIVRWESYDTATQKFEIILPDGNLFLVHQRLIKRVTANEELAFLILNRTSGAVEPLQNGAMRG